MRFYNQVCTNLTDAVWARLVKNAEEGAIDEVLVLHQWLASVFQNGMRQQLISSIHWSAGLRR